MASTLIPGASPAAADLGFGLGDMLGQQVSDETDEQRKKRMAQMQLNKAMGPEQSLAVRSIFGNVGY